MAKVGGEVYRAVVSGETNCNQVVVNTKSHELPSEKKYIEPKNGLKTA